MLGGDVAGGQAAGAGEALPFGVRVWPLWGQTRTPNGRANSDVRLLLAQALVGR